MPYYIIPKRDDESAELDRYNPPAALAFDTRQAAHKQKQVQERSDDVKREVVFWIDCITRDTWISRERERFHDGTYQAVPRILRDAVHCALSYSISQYLYLHRSVKQPGLVAYTPDDEYGMQDRQLACTVGRFVEKYCKDRLTQQQIQDLADDLACDKLDTFSLARTIDDVRAVYNHVVGGWGSCMQRKVYAEYNWQQRMDRGEIDHPVTVYGDSDLGVAYIGTKDKIRQRAVVWPDKKQVVRVYGSGPLTRLLERHGYTFVGGFEGARIRAVKLDRGGYLMPYIDGDTAADTTDDAKYLRLTRRGCIDSQSTCGSSSYVPSQDDEDEDDNTRECDHCGHYYDPDDYNATGDYCARCADSSWSCDRCGDTYFDGDDSTNVEGSTWCDSCASRWTDHCTHCGETFRTDHFSRTERDRRAAQGFTDYCTDCESQHDYCETCDSIYNTEDHDRCPDCPDEVEADTTPTTSDDSIMPATIAEGTNVSPF
jgi:hypothetical protein